MLLNIKSNNIPVSGYVIYNFKQVSDAALLVTYSNLQRKRTMLNFIDGKWRPADSNILLDEETFKKLNNDLSYMAFLNKKSINKNPQLDDAINDQHILLLSGLCS